MPGRRLRPWIIGAAIASAALATATGLWLENGEVPRPAPSVAEVVCAWDGAHVRTRRVRPQRDGIHIKIDNRSGARVFWFQAVDDAGGNQGGRLERGKQTVRTSFPPGEIFVSCFETSRDVSPHVDEKSASVTVVDPQGWWTPSEFVCGRPEFVGRFRAVDVSEPLDAEGMIAGVIEGLLPADNLVRPGYPETQYHSEPRLIVRGGSAIAQADVFQEHGWWKVEVRACPGSGISGHDAASS